jgi:hypothetical protein
MSDNIAKLLTMLQRQSEQIDEISSQMSVLNDLLNEMQSSKNSNDSDKQIISLQQYKDSMVNAEQTFLMTARDDFHECLQIRYGLHLFK